MTWPGTYYWSDEPDGRHLVLTRVTEPRRREAWALHILLFVATLFATTLVGAILVDALPPGLFLAPGPLGADFLRAWSAGFGFSLPLLAILLSHELGHYFTARRYQLDVSPPYFMPGPPPPFGIGTLGAFIRLRTILTDRRQLLDVGAAGPIVGFVVALPVLWIGLSYSAPLDLHEAAGTFTLGPGGHLGDSLVTFLMRHAVLGDAAPVQLHPAAAAGWLGMFITTLNLLPMAQLDGGHILYGALPRWQERVGRGFWVGVMLLGFLWMGWLIWGVLVLLLSRGRLGHPPVLDAYRPLPRSRRVLAWVSLALLVATFAPVPLRP